MYKHRASTMAALLLTASPAFADDLVKNGSFEGPIGSAPTGWSVGGAAVDGYLPVAIGYDDVLHRNYPLGAQGEPVPIDTAASLSPDAAGTDGVYFVSDEAENLSLYQYVHLTPGSYDIGFDSYDTYNGNVQPHDALFTASIAGVQLASFDLASVTPGSWTPHSGVANITAAGDYLVAFTFNTPDTTANPDPGNPNGEYNAKDVVIDRAYVVSDAAGGGSVIPAPAVPEPAAWTMMVGGLGLVGGAVRRRRPTAPGGGDRQVRLA